MKVFMVLGLLVGNFAGFANNGLRSHVLQENLAAKQPPTGLKVSLVADKRSYKRTDDIDLEVKVTNTHGVKDIFVYGTLEFGYRGSFMLYGRDAKGRDVPTRFFPEARTLPPEPNDTSAFVKLLPDHFLGTYSRSSIRKLNMVRPGRYFMWVEYLCPISSSDVRVSPFWGSENGVIKSNVVYIEVVR